MNKYDEKVYRIFRLSLAFEDYLNNTGNNIPEFDEAYISLIDFRKNMELVVNKRRSYE